MAVLKSLYKDYFQKSRIFLYPALGIKRGGSVTPIQSYASWKNIHPIEDCKLSVVYPLRQDPEFVTFEQQRLLGNNLFYDFKMVDDATGVYVFDFAEYAEDWSQFINGKYSKFSDKLKNKIKTYYSNDQQNYAYIESFLYPEKYFKMYAEMINVDEYHIRKVGQLCNKPDLEKECLDVTVKDLEVMSKNA